MLAASYRKHPSVAVAEADSKVGPSFCTSTPTATCQEPCLVETQPSRFVRHTCNTRRCEAEFPVPISDAGVCVPHTRRGTRVGAGCRPPHRRSLQKNPKKPSPRGIKEIPKHKFFPSFLPPQKRAIRAKAHGDEERSGAAESCHRRGAGQSTSRESCRRVPLIQPLRVCGTQLPASEMGTGNSASHLRVCRTNLDG